MVSMMSPNVDEAEYIDSVSREILLTLAHDASFGSGAIVKSRKQKCGCFHCLKIFDSEKVEYMPERDGRETPYCPYCGIDSVLCEDNGYPLTPKFLGAMKKYYF